MLDDSVLFSEDLEIRSFDETKIGEITVQVQPGKEGSNYDIGMHSRWQIGSTYGGVTSHAVLNTDFSIESCKELNFYQKGDVISSRSVKIVPNPDNAEVKTVFLATIEGEEKSIKMEDLAIDAIAPLVTMGISLLYQRFAAVGRSELLLEREAYELDLDCKPVKVKYEVTPGDVEGDLRVKRELGSGDALWNFEYGSDGRLKFAIDENAQIKYTHLKTELPKDIGVLPWEEDIQMISKYLDEKASLEKSHVEYIRTHPRVRGILSDYMHYILIRKPDDVFLATANFFKEFLSESTNTPTS